MHPVIDWLKQRKAVQWTLGYLTVAWVFLQFIETVGGPWEIPNEVLRQIQIAVLAGLAIVVVVAAVRSARGPHRATPAEVLVIAVLALGGAWALTRFVPRGPQVAGGVAVVAVLPPANLGGTEDQDAFLVFLQDQLISLLGRSLAPDIIVMGRQSTARFAGTTLGTPEIAAELAADVVVELSGMATPDTLVITARLTGSAGEQRWSETYRRSHALGLSVGDITESVARGIQAELLGTTADMVRETRSLAAQRCFAQGRAFLNRGLDLEGDLYRAIEYFRCAIDQDPGYAAAHAGVSAAFRRLGAFDMIAPDSAWPNAEAAAREAFRLAPDAEESLLASAWTRVYAMEWEEADRLFRRAVMLNPSFVEGLADYSEFLANLGFGDRAIEFADSAVAIDPANPMAQMRLAWAVGQAGAFERSLEMTRRLSNETPGFGLANWWSSQLLRNEGRFEEALDELRQAIATFDPDDLGDEYAFLAYLYGELGEEDAWQAALDGMSALEAEHGRYISPVARSLAYVGVGDYDTAMALLEEGYRTRAGWIWLVPQPMYPWRSRMSGLPEFQDLLGRIEGGFAPGYGTPRE